MKSSIIWLLLVGAALASESGTGNAWERDKKYTYKVRSRTVTSVKEGSKEFKGILIDAYLELEQADDNTLRGKLSSPSYSSFQSHLEKGWESEVPNDSLNPNELRMSQKPFEIKMKRGTVRDLTVEKDLPTWELNILKSIVSQLQVDTQGANSKKSKHNQLPEHQEPYAMFETMEDSVGGKCKVTYDISPLSERELSDKPELFPRSEERRESEVISIVKTKNYTDCEQRVGYHYGIKGKNLWEPGDNRNSDQLSRSSISRIIVTGKLNRFTIQSSVTTNKVILRPDQKGSEQAFVGSKVNLTLHHMTESSNSLSSPSTPESTGNLVYNMHSPQKSSRRSNRPNSSRQEESRESSSEERLESHERRDRKFEDESSASRSSSEESGNSNSQEYPYRQTRPKIDEPARNPMLHPFNEKHEESSQGSTSDVDLVKAAKKIAREIENEVEESDSMQENQTLEKFAVLTNIVRLMKPEQINRLEEETSFNESGSPNEMSNKRSSKSSRSRSGKTTRAAVRDAISKAGSGPALLNIKKRIEEDKLKGSEAANVIDEMSKSSLTPTSEYMEKFFELVKSTESKNDPQLERSAALSFAELLRKAAVNKDSSHNRFPVHAFGRLFSPKKNRDVYEKYIPHFEERLNSAASSKDSKKTSLYISTLGRIGHPRILAAFEPYLEGRKEISQFQRFRMVLNLNRMAESHPKSARSVLYKLYSNTVEHHEIRTAAVYLLMKTNPPTSMLQRMAEFTNTDSSKQVNSAVKSTIESLAELNEDLSGEWAHLSRSARAAKPLLTTEKYGPQYSRGYFAKYKNPDSGSGFRLEASYIGSHDSILPKAGYISITPISAGLETSRYQSYAAVSSIQDLMETFGDALSKKSEKREKSSENKFSPESLSKILEIESQDSEDLEGFIFESSKSTNNYLPFDKRSIERLPEWVQESMKNLEKGEEFDHTKLSDEELLISFPTETGLPFIFSVKMPAMIHIHGDKKATKESSEKWKLPKSASITGKMHLILSGMVQKSIGFVTPFEQRSYSSGIDRSLKIHLPLELTAEYNTDKKEASLKFRTLSDSENTKIFEYKTVPFIAKKDLRKFETLNDKNSKSVGKSKALKSKNEFSDRGKSLSLTLESEKRSWNEKDRKESESEPLKIAKKLGESVLSVLSPDGSSKVDYEKFSIKLSSTKETTLELKASYDKNEESSDNESESSSSSSLRGEAPKPQETSTSEERKKRLLKDSSKGIRWAKSRVYDLSMKLSGPTDAKFGLIFALSTSNIDKKSRGLLLATAKSSDDREMFFSVGAEHKSSKPKSLDFQETLKSNEEPEEFDAEIRFGEKRNGKIETEEKARIEGKRKQTENRRNEIESSWSAKECLEEKRKSGNKLTKSCRKVNDWADSKDRTEVTITFEDERSMLMSASYEALKKAKLLLRDRAEISEPNIRTESKKIKLTGQMSPSDKKIDLTFETPRVSTKLRNIELSLWPRSQSPDSTENSSSEEKSESLSLSSLKKISTKSTCSLDKTKTTTFDGKTLDSKLGNCWHVVMTSVSRSNSKSSNERGPIDENREVSILARETRDDEKEMKMILGKTEIELSPSSEGEKRARVRVNGKEVHVSREKKHEEKENGKKVLELTELPDKSVKLESEKFDVEVTFDGSRAKIKVGDKHKQLVRGLCGDNDGEPSNDRKSPKNCLLRSSEEFSGSWALTEESCSGPARQNSRKASEHKHCHKDEHRTNNLISEYEAGRGKSEERRTNSRSDSGRSDKNCMKHRTKVERSEKKICFSMRALPACSKSCKPEKERDIEVDFHCVAKNAASEKVADRVEDGANPDLSAKTREFSKKIRVPVSCKS